MGRRALTRTVAEAAEKRPMCAYLRLTVDRNGKKIGYDVQEKAIRKWADYAGETIGHVYKDKDVTAADRTVARDEYEQMLADVEAGIWGGIVVWRLDRLVRLMYEFERCFRLVQDSGGYLVSIDPFISSKDPLGLVFMRLLVLFAEMEIETMKARAKGHRKERAAKGLYNGGGPRSFGFVGAERDPDDPECRILNSGKVGIEHVPHEIALMQEAAHRIANEDWGWTDVIDDWHSRTPPVLGTTGAPIHVFTLQKMLTGPRAIGKREVEVEDDETGEVTTILVKAAWEPVLDEKTWLKLRSLLKQVGPYGPKHSYLLSGVLHCGRCKMALTGAKRKYEIKGEMTSVLTYRCKSGIAEKAKGACGKLSVIAEPVERLVVARVLKRIKETPELLELLAEEDGTDQELVEAYDIIEDCEQRLELLASEFGRREISPSAWMAARGPLEIDLNAAKRTVARISKMVRIPLPNKDQREDLQKWFFGDLNLTQQRKLINAFVDSAEVLPVGRSTAKFDPQRLVVALAQPQKTAA